MITYNGVNLQDSSGLFITDITGLGPTCTINTNSIAGFDGATITSNTMAMRNILITLLLSKPAEKELVYNTFLPKQTGIIKVDNKKIECYVESVDVPTYQKPIRALVSLLCPQPYFESLTQLQAKIAVVVPLFKFPFDFPAEGFYISKKSESIMVAVDNPSSVDVGMEIVFYANSELNNPSLLNINTGELLKVNYTMQAGDKITVNTYRGQKAITFTRNGVEKNIFNYKAQGFKFLQLYQGKNLFRYNADSNLNGLEVTIYYKEYYSGV